MNTPPRLRRWLPPGTDLTPEQAALASAVLAVDDVIARAGAKWGKSFVRLLLARYFATEGGALDLAAPHLAGQAAVDSDAAVALRVLAGVYERMITLDEQAGRPPSIAARVLEGAPLP